MKKKSYYVYIITNDDNFVLYTGVTNDLKLRIFQHKHGLGSKFTQKYDIKKLVYCEEHDDVNQALAREKQIKSGSRKKKEGLIKGFNPDWKDLGGV